MSGRALRIGAIALGAGGAYYFYRESQRKNQTASAENVGRRLDKQAEALEAKYKELKQEGKDEWSKAEQKSHETVDAAADKAHGILGKK